MLIKIPFLELQRESKHFSQEIREAADRVTHRGWYVLGPELEALEKEFAAFLNIPFTAGVASGTDALTLALEGTEAVQPDKKHEVITSSFSAAFTALAIIQAGAIPRFADIDPVTMQIDPEQMEKLIGERTRALMPVHLYGHSCDMRRIGESARKHGLVVIEDACQAHGTRMDGRFLGTMGRAAGFSFYPTKNLGALGDAGIVALWDEDVCRRIKKLRNGGQSRTYCHELPGRNSRLDELQAAILRFKLRLLEDRNEIRRAIAGRYDKAFAGLDLMLLPTPEGLVPNRHLYPIRTTRRQELRDHLANRGIETLIHYPTPLPHQPALRQFVLPGQQFPAAEAAAREVLSLPLNPELAGHEVDYIIQSVLEFF